MQSHYSYSTQNRMEENAVNKQVLQDTTSYVRKELDRIAQELVWADGLQEEWLMKRKASLKTELRRLETLDSAVVYKQDSE
jgi:hypothetical protein